MVRVAPRPVLIPVPDLAAKFGAEAIGEAVKGGLFEFLQRLTPEGSIALPSVASIETSSQRVGGRHGDGRLVRFDHEGHGLRGACREGYCGYHE